MDFDSTSDQLSSFFTIIIDTCPLLKTENCLNNVHRTYHVLTTPEFK